MMYGERRKKNPGFTLVEVLVVVGIVALVSAIAIPGMIKLGAFSRDEFKRTVSHVDSLLRAAQIYSTTYNVNTAVVYSLDNWSREDALTGTPTALADPISDTFTGEIVRQIETAAIMYQLPSTMGPVAGRYIPIPGELGQFQEFPNGMTILLQHPFETTVTGYLNYYPETTTNNYQPTAAGNRVGGFGMTSINAALELPVDLPSGEFLAYVNQAPRPYPLASFPAHVFRPNGRVAMPARYDEECGDCNTIPNDCFICDGERATMFIGPSADRPIEDRFVLPEDLALVYEEPAGSGRFVSNLQHRRIFLYRSTGRVNVPDDF